MKNDDLREKKYEPMVTPIYVIFQAERDSITVLLHLDLDGTGVPSYAPQTSDNRIELDKLRLAWNRDRWNWNVRPCVRFRSQIFL